MELPNGDKVTTGKVVGRKRGLDGEVMVVSNANPILDTRTYDVQFP